jgi:hypothetical protein
MRTSAAGACASRTAARARRALNGPLADLHFGRHLAVAVAGDLDGQDGALSRRQRRDQAERLARVEGRRMRVRGPSVVVAEREDREAAVVLRQPDGFAARDDAQPADDVRAPVGAAPRCRSTSRSAGGADAI